jgi:hypothetical protein
LAGRKFGSDGPAMGSLLLTDRNRPGRQPPNDQEGGFRHIVGEWLTKTKGLWRCGAGRGCSLPVSSPLSLTRFGDESQYSWSPRMIFHGKPVPTIPDHALYPHNAPKSCHHQCD